MKKSHIIVVYEWGCIEPKVVGYAFDYDMATNLAKESCKENDYRPDRDQILWINTKDNSTGYFSPNSLGYDDPN